MAEDRAVCTRTVPFPYCTTKAGLRYVRSSYTRIYAIATWWIYGGGERKSHQKGSLNTESFLFTAACCEIRIRFARDD